MASSRGDATANELTRSKGHGGESAPETLDSTY